MRAREAVALVAAGIAALGASLALGFALAPASHAYPVDHGTAALDGSVPGPVSTVALTSIDDIDALPMCDEEDCSDQPDQTGLWMDPDSGDWFLERGASTWWLIVDDTASGLARGVYAFEGGYGTTYVGGFN